MTLKTTNLFALCGALLLSWPGAAWGCAVCFGQGQSLLHRGFVWGAILLLALPPVLLSAIALLVLRSARRRASALPANHV